MNNDYFFINSSDTSQQLALLDEFLSENYEFRHNVLSDVYEIRELGSEPKPFRPFTREARNSLLRRIKSEGLDIQSPGLNVDEYVYSEETPLYDPAGDWLQSLPAWDGRNHVAELFGRIPGASFVSTTNNPRPLNDPTGSRRYLCIRIPVGGFINNETAIDYEQLYAQVVYELNEKQMRYWFTGEEVRRIEQLNQGFQRIVSLEGMIDTCFRRPKDGETVRPLLIDEILTEILTEFPNIRTTEGIHVRLGKVLKAQNFERKRITQGSAYYIVPRRAAA